jgi:hypothetical protein
MSTNKKRGPQAAFPFIWTIFLLYHSEIGNSATLARNILEIIYMANHR